MVHGEGDGKGCHAPGGFCKWDIALVEAQESHGNQHGGKFPADDAPYGKHRRHSLMLFQSNQVHDIYACDPDDLFQKLGKGRDKGAFQAVIIAVDTGVDAGAGQRVGGNLKEFCASWLIQDGLGKEIRAGDHKRTCQERQENRNDHAGIQE